MFDFLEHERIKRDYDFLMTCFADHSPFTAIKIRRDGEGKWASESGSIVRIIPDIGLLVALSEMEIPPNCPIADLLTLANVFTFNKTTGDQVVGAQGGAERNVIAPANN